MKFVNAELFVIKIMAALVILVAGLAFAKGITVNIAPFNETLLCGLAFILLGQFYRTFRIHEPLAASLTTIGLLQIFVEIALALNYMYLPYLFFGFDQTLANVDAMYGFVWSDFAARFADMPLLMDLLRTVYNSSFIQILLMFPILGLAAKVRDLHILMLTLVIGVLTCVSIWALFPSSSPAGFQPLPADIANKLDLLLSAGVGAELIRLAQEGVSAYPPESMAGLIGFPSFHTVMLVITVYAARNVRVIFYPVLLWNLAMVPAILLHGAHNLIDVFAGIAVAVFSIYCAKKINAVNEPQALAKAALPTEFETQHTN